MSLLVPIFVTQCGSLLENHCGAFASQIAVYLIAPMYAVTFLGLLDPEQLAPMLIPGVALVTFVWSYVIAYAVISLVIHLRSKRIDA